MKTHVWLTTEVRTRRRRWRLPRGLHALAAAMRRLRRRSFRCGDLEIRFTSTGVETWTWKTCVHQDPIHVEEIGSWITTGERILEVRTV